VRKSIKYKVNFVVETK